LHQGGDRRKHFSLANEAPGPGKISWQVADLDLAFPTNSAIIPAPAWGLKYNLDPEYVASYQSDKVGNSSSKALP